MLLNFLKSYLEKSELFAEVSADVKKSSNKSLYYNLPQSARALVCAYIFQQSKKNVLFISQDDKTAEDYLDDFILLCGEENVKFFPDFEVLPYEERSPHFSIRSQRVDTLSNASKNPSSIYSMSIRAFLRNIVPSDIFNKNIIDLAQGSEIDIDYLTNHLVANGYNLEYHVVKSGEAARRGGILDIFVPGQSYPIRLDFFGDEIDSIRYFDPLSQCSFKDSIDQVSIIPAREFSLNDIKKDLLSFEEIHRKGFYEGIELEVSKLLEKTCPFVEYFNYFNTILIIDNYHFLYNSMIEINSETHEFYEKKRKTTKKKLIEPDCIFQNFDYFSKTINCYQTFFLSMSLGESGLFSKKRPTDFSSQNNFNGEIDHYKSHLRKLVSEGFKIIIQSENISQQKRMRELLEDLNQHITYYVGVLQKGFTINDIKLSIFTDHEIFNRYKRKKYHDSKAYDTTIVDYESLSPGDYIVHIVHGIGIYEGLKKIQVGGNLIECLSISYTGNDRVYVPTYQLRLISKYIAEEGVEPVIHKLGSKKWENDKKRAKKEIELIAEDIVNLYAERSLRSGLACNPDNIWQGELEDSFVFEDTPDQQKATSEIKKDMESPQPMERLLCGDVGFGKTEVAVRAAFKAVLNGLQVALLVPTTLLAEQHYLVFKERLAQYPVNIAMFSRFRSPAVIKVDLLKLQQGQIDIAIGTHRLISEDVKFSKLGLLIIDEEHRFGVRHKEKLRKLKSNIDTLYMSATPIPRTLNMTFAKLKEISLMQTSPKARLPIRTAIIEYDHNVIKEAILNEIDRGGQVFFLHNRVESIETIATDLRNLLPGCSIKVGHGQLPERTLENVMLDFAHHKFDILVATTIIESGLDIPNANTIIVNRADRFGLAQLYQIRGRVGRSNRRAYAYFIIPKNLNPAARKRLEALSEYNTLGAGYQIAMRDLELRGAGTLLGTKQSGVVTAIGFNYYNHLLEQAVKNIQNKNPNGIWEDEKDIINEYNLFRVDADYYFPDNYISDDTTRLNLYKRMMKITDLKKFDDFLEELKDRFGDVPKIAINNIIQHKIRLIAHSIELDSFKFVNGSVIIVFNQKKLPSKHNLSQLVRKYTYPVKFDISDNKLQIIFDLIPKNDNYYKMTPLQKNNLLEKVNEILLFIKEFMD